eukprot:3607242-Rhodomonas_salina.1
MTCQSTSATPRSTPSGQPPPHTHPFVPLLYVLMQPPRDRRLTGGWRRLQTVCNAHPQDDPLQQ